MANALVVTQFCERFADDQVRNSYLRASLSSGKQVASCPAVISVASVYRGDQ